MAESNATQVILTDDGIKIIKAQNMADNAAGGVTDLNDPNLMSVIEKQNNIGQFAGLTSQYNVILQNAKDDGIDTTAVTTAYNNLNQFMAGVLANPDHASDIDRATYKKYQDAYNEELANLQNALQNNTNDKFTSAASALSQAASTANVAKSAADSTYAYANSEIAVQSTA
ncbi:phage tail protein, partial [Lactiplantibacillus sp. ME-2]|nr:phage tail protein [Lactiplantibacillus sp. ME-2]